MQNTFKNNQPPNRTGIAEIIGRPAHQVLKLNPPFFKNVANAIRKKQPKVNRLQFSIFRTL